MITHHFFLSVFIVASAVYSSAFIPTFNMDNIVSFLDALPSFDDLKSIDAEDSQLQDILSRKLKQKLEKIQRQEKGYQRLTQTNPWEFKGKHKWLGGGIDPNTGYIYGVPSHASFVLCIHPSTDNHPAKISKIHLPEEYRRGQFKWLRCIIYQGFMYGIPAWSTQGVLKVRLFEKNVSTMESLIQNRQRVQILPLPELQQATDESSFTDRRNVSRNSSIDRNRWMWHGGQIGLNIHTGKKYIYAIPSNAQRVLKICLETDTVMEIGPSFTQGQNKFYGGILGVDGCIYGMPYTASRVLRIDPCTDKVQLIGPTFPEGCYKWHGGLKAHSTGVIYAFPAHAKTVLCINTNMSTPSTSNLDPTHADDEDWRVYTIPITRGKDDVDSLDLKYKWLGGAYGADGCIYGMPSDASSILRIDPITDTAITFGHIEGKMNKFQGGVLSPKDKCVYAVPADMDCVLRIRTDPELPVVADTIGNGLGDVEDKWQGGFLANDGKIYGIPECINHVMVLTPGDEPTVEFFK